MNFIEPRTLAFIISVLTALSALILLAMRQSFSATVRGVNSWTIGIWIFLICSLLFNFRGQLHPLFSVVLANLLLIISLLLMISGLLHYHGRRLRHHGLIGIATVVFTTVIVWFTLIQPNFQFRLVFVAGILAFILAGLGYLALHGRPVTTGRVVTGAAFLLGAVTCFLRALSVTLNFDRPNTFFDLSSLQVLYLGAFSVTFFIGTLGFILMINERLREILQYNAEHDELSAALTRRAFFEKTEAELSNSRKSGKPVSVLILDLDNFKQINDAYGHHFGDQVIVDFCDTVRSVLRPNDVLGRYGGEEFVVLLPETDSGAAIKIAERIRTALHRPRNLPPYTASVGVATTPTEVENTDSLLIRADKALYRAKGQGRDRIEVAQSN